MKKIFLSFSAVILSFCCYGQAVTSSVDSIMRSYESFSRGLQDEFEEFKTKAQEEYDEYVRIATEEFEAYKRSIGRVWGQDDVITSTKTTWVEYSPDYGSRSIVDFKEGKVTVEVAIEEKNFTDSTTVNILMAEAVAEVLESRGSTCPYPSRVDTSEPLTAEPILDGIVDLTPYSIPEERPDAHEDRKTVAEAITTQSAKTVATAVGNDGENRVMVQLEINLVADNISKNAMLYKDYVSEFSQKFQIEQPLIYAVMEQESYFNPEAVSPANACGLMQLVATSGGYDAYKYVYKKDWVPTRSYLFNPRNNIELGTAYLRILMNQFKAVSNPDCRRLCVIAGYNTGAGNVSRAFTGRVSVGSAVGLINGYDYKGLYNHLTTRLNSQEARNYVAGVSRKREKYLP